MANSIATAPLPYFRGPKGIQRRRVLDPWYFTAATGGSVLRGAAIGAGAGAVTGAATDEDDIDLDD